MLHGFEDITAELTPDELALVPLFVKGFGDKLGEENAVTSKQIIRSLEKRRINAIQSGEDAMPVTVTGPRIRKIVNHIRMHGLVRNLVATSRGYFIETDPSKIAKYKQSLKARAKAINAVADSFQI